MPKTLIVCCDGTWNTPDQQGRPTNVTKMARAILPRAADGTPQVVHYDEGVGTGNRWDRFTGGTLGVGLGKNVRQAYRFLALNYEPGDGIAMFGFSRGAFTVRSLAGLVNLVGLLRKGDLDKMSAVWEYYRTEPAKRRKDFIDPRWIQDRDPGVDLLGVWDTVGSLGIPFSLLRSVGRRHYQFHDVALGAGIRRAYQALAIDEHRRNFQPAIWDTRKVRPEQEVEQVWFAGAHSNVGGGYEDPVLSDQAFLWMVNKARPLLSFDEGYISDRCEVLAENEARGEAIESLHGLWKLFGYTLRKIGTDTTETVHPSALARLAASEVEYKGTPPEGAFKPYPYRPKNLLEYRARRGG